MKEGRKYETIGTASSDSLFEVEALGIPEYGYGFTLIVDFSDCLDYVLHRTFGCKIEDIRGIDRYEDISWAILNNDFSRLDTDVTFDRLLSSSKELSSAFAKLSKAAKSNNEISVNDQASWVAYQFYVTVLLTLCPLKFYTAMEVCNNLSIVGGQKGTVRSQNFSSVIATVHAKFSEPVVLHQIDGTFDDYSLIVRSYAPYEYLGEVIRKNELSRKLQNS